jgi:hypothetical protein
MVHASLTRFFSGLARFGFDSVVSVSGLKTETEPIGFFKILIGFFHSSVFSVILFSSFLGLISFSVFLFTLCMSVCRSSIFSI